MKSIHPFSSRVLSLLSCALLVGLVFTAIAWGNEAGSGSAAEAEAARSQHLTLMIVYAVVALVFSFLCSVAEAVVLSVSPSYIANRAKSGDEKGAALLDKIKTNIDRSLAAILTLNTIAHTIGAGGAGAEAAAYFGDRYVGLAMAVLTLLILFLSEIIPKTLGALYWRTLAPTTARFVQLLIWVLYPLILISELLTKFLARGQSIHQFNREEFTAMVDLGAEAGQLDATESRILNNLFRFPQLCTEDIMTPRTVMFSLQEDMKVREVMESQPEINFSRIPVFSKNRDEVTGFVLKVDILINQHSKDGRGRLRDIKREIRAIHVRTPLGKVLEELLDNRSHILLVVDDYGGTDGIVTLEDVVETLIGIEIVDEADTIDDMRRLARQKWEARMERVGIDIRKPREDAPAEDADE